MLVGMIILTLRTQICFIYRFISLFLWSSIVNFYTFDFVFWSGLNFLVLAEDLVVKINKHKSTIPICCFLHIPQINFFEPFS